MKSDEIVGLIELGQSSFSLRGGGWKEGTQGSFVKGDTMYLYKWNVKTQSWKFDKVIRNVDTKLVWEVKQPDGQ